MAKIELFCGWTNLRAAAWMNMCWWICGGRSPPHLSNCPTHPAISQICPLCRLFTKSDPLNLFLVINFMCMLHMVSPWNIESLLWEVNRGLIPPNSMNQLWWWAPPSWWILTRSTDLPTECHKGHGHPAPSFQGTKVTLFVRFQNPTFHQIKLQVKLGTWFARSYKRSGHQLHHERYKFK